MKRLGYASTALRSIGYVSSNKVLEVEWAGGKIYHYPDVKPEEYQALLLSHSKGAYITKNIKPNYKAVKGEYSPPSITDQPNLPRLVYLMEALSREDEKKEPIQWQTPVVPTY